MILHNNRTSGVCKMDRQTVQTILIQPGHFQSGMVVASLGMWPPDKTVMMLVPSNQTSRAKAFAVLCPTQPTET